MSEFQNPTNSEIDEILKNSKRIAVVGMSSKPERASHGVSKRLIARGYEVIPVNPTEAEVLGLKSYASLGEVPGQIDIVDVFRRSDQTDPIIDEAIAIKAKVLWLQEDVINDSGANRAKQAGLQVIQDRCIAKELMRL
ncbi:MAG: CoA-binding protein [bacterium]|nr:CoA-binding protein [bacterium]